MILLLLTSLISLAIGLLLMFFIQQTYRVSRKELGKSHEELNKIRYQLSTFEMLIRERENQLKGVTQDNTNLKNELKTLETNCAHLSAISESKSNLAVEYQSKNKEYEIKIEKFHELIQQLKAENSSYKAENSSLKEKQETQKKEMEDLNKTSLLQFESIANKIFEEKTTRFSKTNKENILQILSPLKENLKDFKMKVEETYDKESKERFSLESKIKELVELNQQISKDAINLTNALKGQAKTQGNWGEMILESILERSGLVKGREYFTQESYLDDNGIRKQPDVIIKYPNERHIIVDSKVSLTEYERFANCTDKNQQKIHLANHIKSIRSHIDNLSSKDYDKIDKSLDFVMLFVPIEPAYITAIHYDQELWNYAYQKRILLISPTNLIASLKMILDIWKRENQNTNALEIAKRGEKLYDKFVGFISDMDEIDKALNKATEKYSDAMGKLSTGRGNLISQAEKLKSMGLNPKKSIEEKHIESGL